MSASTDTMTGAMDKLLEHRARLAICVLLSRNDKMNFSRFKELLGETDGNLGAQLRKLEDAGYVTARKTFQGRKPVSWYKLSSAGKKALKAHIGALSTLLESAFIE